MPAPSASTGALLLHQVVKACDVDLQPLLKGQFLRDLERESERIVQLKRVSRRDTARSA